MRNLVLFLLAFSVLFTASAEEKVEAREVLSVEESIKVWGDFFGSSGEPQVEEVVEYDPVYYEIKGESLPKGDKAFSDSDFQAVRSETINKITLDYIETEFSAEESSLLRSLYDYEIQDEEARKTIYEKAKKRFSDHFIWPIMYGANPLTVSSWNQHYESMQMAKVPNPLLVNICWNFNKQHSGEFSGKWRKRFEQSFSAACSVGVSDNLLMTLLHYAEDMNYLNGYNRDVRGFMKRASADQKIDPYIRNLYQGILSTRYAWEARGSGFADTVTPEGWDGFQKHLATAKSSLQDCWDTRPSIVHAPYQMMIVAKGLEGGQTMRTWFDRTVSARLEYKKAYTEMYWGYMPRWFGSHEQMLGFARECFEQGMFETRVAVEYALHVNYQMKKDFESMDEQMQVPGVYDHTKTVILEALKHESSRYHHDYLRYYLLSAAFTRGSAKDLLRYLPEQPSFDYPNYLLSTFGPDVATFLDSMNQLRRDGMSEEEIGKKAELYLMLKSSPVEALRRMETENIPASLSLSLVEKMEFSADPEFNQLLLSQFKRYDRVELALKRLKEFRDQGMPKQSVESLVSSLESLASAYQVECVMLLPYGTRASEEACQELYEEYDRMAKDFDVSPQEVGLAQSRLMPFVSYRNWNGFKSEWAKKVRRVKDFGALLDMVTTWKSGKLTSVSYWNIFRNRNSNLSSVDRFFQQWNSSSPNARSELFEYLRQVGLPGVMLEVANRLKGTPHSDVGEQWVIRIINWWKATLRGRKDMVLTYRAMQCFLKADGYQDIARVYALQHEPITKSNSGKWLSAYLHCYYNDLAAATKALVAGKYSRFKDSGRFDIPGHTFRNPHKLMEHVLAQVLSHEGLSPQDRETLRKEFPTLVR